MDAEEAELRPRIDAAKALRMWAYKVDGYESHYHYEHAVKILGKADADWLLDSYLTPRKGDTVWIGSKATVRSYSMWLPSHVQSLEQ